MANKFDIDSSADTHLLNETFHVFSKSPGSPTTTLGGARLKSGHTTTATDVWADEIPAFFNAATQAKFELFQSKAVKDDLCLFDGKVYQHNGTAFVSLGTTDEVLVDGKTFSKNDKAVVKYHKGRTAINLTADNNNGDGSNDYTAKIYNAATGSTTFVPQFISAMDKMVDGIPSLAYDAVVSDNTGVLAEGLTADNDYICNSYAGVIQFNIARSQGSVTVSAWEYIGEKLTASLTELAKKVDSVTATAGEGVQAVTDVAAMAGLSVSTKEITVEGEADPVSVKALDIRVANVDPLGIITSGDENKLVTASNAHNIATKAASDAISTLDSSLAWHFENAELPDQVALYQENGKIIDFYIRTANVAENGSVPDDKTGYLVTAQDAQRIADAAVDALVIPEVANATADKAGTVKIATGEVSKETTDTSTAPYVVPTVGALAATRNAIEQRITELHKAGVSYVVADTLPTITAGTEADYNGKIYLVNTGLDNKVAADGARIEYMYVNKGTESAPQWGWEQIGTTTADLSGYAKSVKINDSKSIAADSTGSIDLSDYELIESFYNDVAEQGSGNIVPNVSSVKLLKGGSVWGIGVIDATSTDKGLVTLTSTYSATDETSAVTGKAVASAISTAIDGIDTGVTGITVNGGSKQTGDVTLNVVTSFANSDTGSTTVDFNAIRATNWGRGNYEFAAVVADSANRGVTYLYDKTATGLGSATNATVTENTVKSVYDTLDAKIPTTYVSTVNGSSGAINLKAGGNLWYLSNPSDTQSNLWGLNLEKSNGSEQFIIDGFIGNTNAYGNIGSMYTSTASLPANATKVIGNFVYGSGGKVIDTIRAERMVSGFSGRDATGLTEWVADMPNLKDCATEGQGTAGCFYDLHNLTTFIGDLSSLVNGDFMFYHCNTLETFIGDLSSLENGTQMFTKINEAGCKLNAESVECILESIPTYTSGTHELGLSIHVDAVETFNEITGAQLPATKGSSLNVSYKGWTIKVYVSNAD